ncbi:MAG: hypothetical protein IKR57_02110 [Bacilli bacterium]|nr:hypothetical protein [Bacilli bacterium]
MKRSLMYFIIVFALLVVIKYRFSSYSIEYKVNNYDIKETYKSGRFYYEIKKDDLIYNFDEYYGRNFNKTLISKIEEIKDENISCIYPTIKKHNTYPLCYYNEEYTDYHLINSDLLSKYKKEEVDEEKNDKDFKLFDNLSKNEYIALWNYNGYIIMNGNTYENLDIFDKEKYDNSLAYIIDDTIYMANYDQEHEYDSLIAVNIKELSIELIELEHMIDYDSYIVGNIEDMLYIFDGKYSKLYEINTRNYKVKIIGDNENGFVKYINGKFENCSKNEYKINKIKYNINDSKYTYNIDDGVYKIINDNKDIVQKINNNNVNYVYENGNKIYYTYLDNFYSYTPNDGENKIFYNYELTFNKDNTIFVYSK